jgi:FlaA1/EpsC-like NDP-sugar epimerase
MAMAVVVVIAFYYSDLYAIDQTLSVQELMHRFVTGLGAACIVIGVISYPIPNFGKSIYISEMLMMGISLGIWRFGFMRVIKQAAIRANVLIIGIRSIGKLIAEELYLKRKLGMEVIGFVGTEAGLVTLSYGNPKKSTFQSLPPSLAT